MVKCIALKRSNFHFGAVNKIWNSPGIERVKYWVVWEVRFQKIVLVHGTTNETRWKHIKFIHFISLSRVYSLKFIVFFSKSYNALKVEENKVHIRRWLSGHPISHFQHFMLHEFKKVNRVKNICDVYGERVVSVRKCQIWRSKFGKGNWTFG